MKQNSFYRNGMILIPTASFDDCGGWFVDSEFILQMGAPYLLAHGLGLPVSDAVTRFSVPKEGTYHVYAYTYNWVSPWHEDMTPGIFNVFVDKENTGEFGHTSSWSWEQGKDIVLEEGEHTIEFKYRVPGLIIGSSISVLAFIGLLVFLRYNSKYRVVKKRRFDHLFDANYLNRRI